MKTILGACLLVGVFAMSAVAVEKNNERQVPRPDFQTRKAQVLQRIDKREARIQEEKNCIQAAKSHEDVRMCREKFRPKLGFDH